MSAGPIATTLPASKRLPKPAFRDVTFDFLDDVTVDAAVDSVLLIERADRKRGLYLVGDVENSSEACGALNPLRLAVRASLVC